MMMMMVSSFGHRRVYSIFTHFFYATDNAIKWPELDGASAMHPLPARPTGRSGVETNALDRSEDAFDGASIAGSSTADLAVHAASGPYSQPHPEQQYYDDPSHAPAGGYYDPYSGPVPATITSPAPAESPYRTMSPGPNMGYDAQQMAYAGGGRTPSPGPAAAYGVPGRVMSPGAPPQAYSGRTPSPGPQAAYGGRTSSPGPQAAYGGRTPSPGPHAAYGGDGYR